MTSYGSAVVVEEEAQGYIEFSNPSSADWRDTFDLVYIQAESETSLPLDKEDFGRGSVVQRPGR